jgi:hypothetical protein
MSPKTSKKSSLSSVIMLDQRKERDAFCCLDTLATFPGCNNNEWERDPLKT